ncbi:MAG TPA: hypothetical protein VKA74_19525 [Myxococcota bacterium]|nr:hypothetical protein [Myxococcota bacterium]
MRSRRLLVIGMLGVIGSSGCTNVGRIEIRAKDGDVLQPGARVEWKLAPNGGPPSQGLFDSEENPASVTSDASASPEESRSTSTTSRSLEVRRAGSAEHEAGATREEARARRLIRPTLSLDLDYVAAVDAEDEANLSASQFVDFDGRDFIGPQRTRSDLTLHVASTSVRGGLRLIDLFALEVLAGVSLSALDLEIRGAGTRSQDLGFGLGPMVGARFTFTPHPVVDLYGQWQLHLLEVIGSDGRDGLLLRSREAGVRLHLTRHLSLFGGWREWDYDENVENESDIDLDLSGPTFGSLLRF